MRAALYARVSTDDQDAAIQVAEIRAYCARRGWRLVLEYVDRGVSGAAPTRPTLDTLRKEAARGRFDVLVVWKLDRLGRKLRALLLFLDELQALDVSFASVTEGLDFSTPAGRCMVQLLAVFAEYERGILVERVKAGIADARRRGTRLGRPRQVSRVDVERTRTLSLSKAAAALGVARSTVAKCRKELR